MLSRNIYAVEQIDNINTRPDISIDWSMGALVNQDGNFIDNLEVRSTASGIAHPADYKLLDNNIMRMNAGRHIQTVNGIPDLLLDYQGDFTMVYHGACLATGGISFLLTLVPTFGAIAGWVIKINGTGYEAVFGRISGHDLSKNLQVPTTMPFSDLHTISFVYKEKYTATDSRLEIYWDGILVNSVENPYSPIRWNTGNNLYFGRFVNQLVNGVSFLADFKIFKRALSGGEMLDQHLNRPSPGFEFFQETKSRK
jgi:hypothetical protein